MMSSTRNTLPSEKFSSEMFTWNKETYSFSAEMSDFAGIWHGALSQQIWADSCDTGFIMNSHRTGKDVVFIETAPTYDLDGELICLNFESFRSPTGQTLYVVIFND